MKMRVAVKKNRMLEGKALLLGAVLAAFAAGVPHAEEQQPGWQLRVQGPYGFASGGAQGSYYFQTTPGTAFSALNGTRGFTDLSVAQSFGLGRELGIGNTQITAGVRVAEPLIANGFTPALDQRRFVGTGPRLGFSGDQTLGSSSWAVEWQVGASMLFNTGADAGAANTAVVSNYSTPSGGSLVNVDGLLGLTYFFDTASKLTVGYRADAYFRNSAGYSSTPLPAQDTARVDHGPMVRFTIQK